ncbi:xylulokinase [Labrys miyagiensis]
MRQHVLILDVGTSALKAVLFGDGGTVVGSASEPLATQTDADRSVEQNVEDWWQAACLAVARLPHREAVGSVGLTGSMQNVIALAQDGRPLGPAILYSDRRLGADDIEAVRSRLPADYGDRTGNQLDPAHCILKLMHFDRFFPGRGLAEAGTVLFGAKDAVIHRMTGKAVIDPTTATTTGLYNIRAGRWDPDLVAAAGIGPTQLPAIGEAFVSAGVLLPQPAHELGLPAGVPVYHGAGDGAAATWGAFADELNSAYVYLGTTGWVAATMRLEDARPPRDTYTLSDPCHAERAIVIAPMLNAGSALDWLVELTNLPLGELLLQAGEDGAAPIFLPYLLGERSPFEDQAVRGAFIGLDKSHGPGALCRSVLEGIAFAVRHNLEAANLPPIPLTVIGGGARGTLQLQLIADALNRPVRAPTASQDMPALGTYRMLTLGADLAPVQDFEEGATVNPRISHVARAERRYQTYLSASGFARSIAQDLS